MHEQKKFIHKIVRRRLSQEVSIDTDADLPKIEPVSNTQDEYKIRTRPVTKLSATTQAEALNT